MFAKQEGEEVETLGDLPEPVSEVGASMPSELVTYEQVEAVASDEGQSASMEQPAAIEKQSPATMPSEQPVNANDQNRPQQDFTKFNRDNVGQVEEEETKEESVAFHREDNNAAAKRASNQEEEQEEDSEVESVDSD